MTNELKQRIAAEVNTYRAAKQLKQADLAQMSGVPESYVSIILSGKTSVGSTEIDQKYYLALAELAGVDVLPRRWKLVQTTQFKRMIIGLQMAKETGETKTLIGASGSGKTNAINLFRQQNPVHTYVITINNLMSVSDVINALVKLLDVPRAASKSERIENIVDRLKDVALRGGKPVIIFDESENMNGRTMGMMKGVYDRLHGLAGIVLVGTPKLLKKMEHEKAVDREAGPQFYRRFKSGIAKLSDTKEFKPFFEMYNIDVKLRRLLTDICANYGELRDYLEPAMKQCEERGEQLTEEYFRLMYDLPGR